MEDRVVADLRDSYGIAFHEIAPVSGGWLNRKWKISTDRGDFLVKEFSNERFSRKHLRFIESALQRQMILEKNGVPCPVILPYEGRAIRIPDDETAYMVMEFCPGKMEGPDTVTRPQMESLGDAAGRMRAAFARLPADSAKGFPVRDEETLDSMWANFHARARECPESAPAGYREAVLALEPILNSLTPAFFERLPKGIAHEDFSHDNILFEGDNLSAILDFDRSLYTYVWHDVGRALLCFALKDGKLDLERIHAFLAGYNRHLPLARSDVADALRLAWCVEAPWWIRPEFFGENPSPKVARFRDEMIWLTEHWFEVDSMLQ